MGEQTMTQMDSPPAPRPQQRPGPSGPLPPITPPQSPRPEKQPPPPPPADDRRGGCGGESSASLDTTASSRRSTRSHREYLDSLQPPSGEEFARLARVQEEREREHRRRNQALQEQAARLACKSAEARHNFVEAQQQQQQHQVEHQVEQHQQQQREQLQPQSQSQLQPQQQKEGRLYGLLDLARQHGRNSSTSSSSGRRAAKAAAASGSNDDGGDDDDDVRIRFQAATLIQRSYRGYRVRREMRGLGLNAGTRWTHAIRDAQWRQLNEPRSRGDGAGGRTSGVSRSSRGGSGSGAAAEEEDEDDEGEGGGSGRQRSRSSASATAARRNWKKAARIAIRAGGDQDSSGSEDEGGGDERAGGEGDSRTSAEQRDAERKRRADAREKMRRKARTMGLQYFLEMVDLKHRYGSNLRQYHEEWKKADTNENFFYWLDRGDGRNIELDTCPRERLDREQVRYLSREERQNYLVKVDSEGRLCWAKNGVRIDTTEQWKDSINGIVPVDDSTPAFAPSIESPSQSLDRGSRDDADSHSDDEGASPEASESELEAARAAKYATPVMDDAKGLKKVRHVSAATIFDKLLRKSVRKNTWIFVADTSFRLYVGIKASGSFQHSSFLQGGRISAAGLIKIRNGRLSSLSPLSGHYRPPASSFRAFVHGLRDQGVDMGRVSISKSYAVLVGLEAYVKTRAKGREALRRATRRKERLLDPEQARRRDEAERDKSHSAALERRTVEREAEEEERRLDESRVSVRLMQRLGLHPREPPVQKKEEPAV